MCPVARSWSANARNPGSLPARGEIAISRPSRDFRAHQTPHFGLSARRRFELGDYRRVVQPTPDLPGASGVLIARWVGCADISRGALMVDQGLTRLSGHHTRSLITAG